MFRVRQWHLFFRLDLEHASMAFPTPALWVFQPGSCGIGQGPGPGDMYEATKWDVKDFCDFNSAVSCSPQCRDATSQLGPLTHAAIQLTAQFKLWGLVLLTHSKDAFKGFYLCCCCCCFLSFLQYAKSVEKIMLFLFCLVCRQLYYHYCPFWLLLVSLIRINVVVFLIYTFI